MREEEDMGGIQALINLAELSNRLGNFYECFSLHF